MHNKLEEVKKTLEDYKRKRQHYQAKLEKLTYRSLGYVPHTGEWQASRPILTLYSEFGEGQESEGLQMYTKDELRDMDRGDLQEEVAELEKKIENTTVDLSVLDEYLKRAQEHAARSADLDATKTTATAENNHYKELVKLRLNEFTEGMDIINAKLKEMYRMITMGGNAALEYVEPFEDGVEFKVRPPKKGWKHISNLSGGEKTLSSLALVFALHHYKPTPLYVMDEIDAALDFRNVSF
jgi:structural maintenance of chromosome 4